MAEVLVYGEHAQGRLEPITRELLAAAQGLGDRISVALQGDSFDGISSDVISLGADRVYLVQHALLAGGTIDAHVAAFEQVCRQVKPSLVLIGRTMAGRDVGPRVAFRLGVGLAQDCIEVVLDREANRVVATRPVYGGNALATVTFPDIDPQVVVLRDNVYDPLKPDASRTGDIVDIDVELDSSVVKVRHVETVHEKSDGLRLEDARVVVCGGRGLGGSEPFKALEELAGLLGGAVGASRAPCDAGWIDHNHQVGLTGKTVTADLYISVGISGASQHMAGCSRAKHIVAINRDPEANIFREATYGVVGDWKAVLPSFIESVRDLIGT